MTITGRAYVLLGATSGAWAIAVVAGIPSYWLIAGPLLCGFAYIAIRGLPHVINPRPEPELRQRSQQRKPAAEPRAALLTHRAETESNPPDEPKLDEEPLAATLQLLSNLQAEVATASETISKLGRMRTAADRPTSVLTNQERAVIDQFAIGRTSQEIADELKISAQTVQLVVRRGVAKLRIGLPETESVEPESTRPE